MALLSGNDPTVRYRAAVGADPGALGPFALAGAPTDGASGSFAGVAAPGALLIDTVNANLYLNAGTQAAPAWKLVTRAA